MWYERVIRPLLFRLDAERAHELTLRAAQLARLRPVARLIAARSWIEDPRLAVQCAGLTFRNPLGLAAGCDKNADAIALFAAFGFGHLEIGTVTAHPQSGNPRPRVIRLPFDHAVINRMGFPSQGAQQVKGALSRARANLAALGWDIKLGVNIGKTKVVPIDEAARDYLESFRALYESGDYFVVNVSSPNTPELRRLQERGRLEELLRALQAANLLRKPLFVKVAPDLSWSELDEVVEAARATSLSGIIATNTTFSRDGLRTPTDEAGGLSGAPLFPRALAFVEHLHKLRGDSLALIGVGGVTTPQHFVEMLRAGADMVQVYTAFVYQGPSLVPRFLRALRDELAMHGMSFVHELRETRKTR